jgi:hypothetical protein
VRVCGGRGWRRHSSKLSGSGRVARSCLDSAVRITVRLRYEVSLFVSFVYLVAVLLLPVWHAMEVADGKPLQGGACLWSVSSGAVVQSPCTSGGPCTNPNHHHSGQQRDPGACPLCSGVFAAALGSAGSTAAVPVEVARPVCSRAAVFVGSTLIDPKVPRAPPLLVI